MQRRPIVIGTRGSALALWQAERIAESLHARYPDRHCTIRSIRTGGDVSREVALAEIGTRGIFVKEIEAALLAREVDLGVHSLKDLPSSLPDDLALAAVSPREDPRDALITRSRCTLSELPAGARLGTSSPRRGAQLLAARPDLVIENIRGNVDTRVRKALEGNYDGIVLAVAGLRRLGLEDRISEYMPLTVMLPAPGQGVIAVEARTDDDEMLGLAAGIDDVPTHLAVRAERAMVRALGGGCTTPIGAYGVVEGEAVRLQGMVASPDGKLLVQAESSGSARHPESVGAELAKRLWESGGGEVLEALGYGKAQGIE